MRVINTEVTTPDGNKYNATRAGRLCLTSGVGIYGLVKALKEVKSDEYVKTMTQSAQKAAKLGLHNFPRVRKTAFVSFAVLIAGLLGFVSGGIIDFTVNKIARNKADKKA